MNKNHIVLIAVLIIGIVLVSGCASKTKDAGTTPSGTGTTPPEQAASGNTNPANCVAFDSFTLTDNEHPSPTGEITSGTIWGIETYKGKQMCHGYGKHTLRVDPVSGAIISNVDNVYFTTDFKEVCLVRQETSAQSEPTETCYKNEPQMIKITPHGPVSLHISTTWPQECPKTTDRLDYKSLQIYDLGNVGTWAPKANLIITGDAVFVTERGDETNCVYDPSKAYTYCDYRMLKIPGTFTVSYLSAQSNSLSCPE